jgi:hypothetical protein
VIQQPVWTAGVYTLRWAFFHNFLEVHPLTAGDNIQSRSFTAIATKPSRLPCHFDRVEPDVRKAPQTDYSDLPSLDFSGSPGAHVVHTVPSN